jgi:predicted ferric reductase
MGEFSLYVWEICTDVQGFTGLLAFTLLNITSLRYVRQKIYEFFLITHIFLVALTLAAFIMHWRAVDKWIYPGIGLWAADRLFRILRLFILNKLWTVIPSPTAANLPSTATLTLLTPSTLKISFQTPSAHLSWSAGQHFYVVMPGMAQLPWEAHPFTATTIPKHPGSGTESGELTFIVRVRDGFTKRMKQAVDKERKALGLGVEEECKIEVKAAVEGPYGYVRKLDMYDGVLVVAGKSDTRNESHALTRQADQEYPSLSPICYKSSKTPRKANLTLVISGSSGWSSLDVSHSGSTHIDQY